MSSRRYNALVLSGGGSLGVMFCGALLVLQKRNILKHIKCFVGTSIGALTACCLALGYNVDELLTDFNTLSLEKMHSSLPKVTTIYNCVYSMGMYSTDTLATLIKTRIAAKSGSEMLTFQELYDLSGHELHVTACNVMTGQTEYFSIHRTPDMDIQSAVCMSMCVPILFQPMEHQNIMYVDGATFGHHSPVHFYSCDTWKVLSLCLKPNWYKSVFARPRLNTFIGFVSKLLTGIYESTASANSMTLVDTIALEFDMDMLASNISNDNRTAMIQEGIHATESFFGRSNRVTNRRSRSVGAVLKRISRQTI